MTWWGRSKMVLERNLVAENILFYYCFHLIT